MPLRIHDYIASFHGRFPFLDPMIEPWRLTADVSRLIERFTASLDLSAFHQSAGVLVHREATTTLDLPRPPAPIAQEAPLVVEEKSGAPLVMVVDDSLTVRKITSRMLAREGFEFVTAKDGVDALRVHGTER